MIGINEVAVTQEGSDEVKYFGLPKRGRVILYPDGIMNIEDSGGRTTTCRWGVTKVQLSEGLEVLREMA